MAKLRRFLRSLKFRIVALGIGSGLVAALGTGAALIQSTEHSLQRQLLASDKVDRERTAALLGSKLETLKSALAAVAGRVPPEVMQDVGAAGAFLLDKPAAGVLFDSVFLARADGLMLARLNGGRLVEELPPVSDRAYFKQAMLSDQPIVSDPLMGKVDSKPVIIMAVAILDRDGRPTGIVGGSIRLQSNSLFSDPSGTRDDGVRDLVIDRAGAILSHSAGGRILGRAHDEPGLKTAFGRWSGSGSPIDTVATAELGEADLISMSGIPLSEWQLVRLTPRAMALAPIAEARRTAIIVASCIGLLVSLLSGWAAWATSRPIGQLQSKIESILRNEEGAEQTWPRQATEISAMANAFQTLLREREVQRVDAQMLLHQLQAVVDNAQVGIALVRHGRFEIVSRQFCQIMRARREALIGQRVSTTHASSDCWQTFNPLASQALDAEGVFDHECELVRGSGERFWARLRGRAIVRGDRLQGSIWVIEDATEEKSQRERLSWAASHDQLTGLMNRAMFEVVLDEAAARAAEEPFCALFIDLDRFKQVNDTGGHAAGDALLKRLSKTLTGALRETDTLARLGGDEFAVLLPRCPTKKAQAIAESIRAAVERFRLEWNGNAYGVGASIGLVAVNGRHAGAADVLRDADAACYEAKRSGRDRVVTSVAV